MGRTTVNDGHDPAAHAATGQRAQPGANSCIDTATPATAHPRRGRWTVPLVAIVAVLALIAGLVIWAPWANKVPASNVVYQQMRSNAAAAKSVHIKGAFIEKGQKLQIDIAGDRAGTNTRVIVNDGTGAVEILTVNGHFHLKANAAYWTKNGSAAIAKVAAGKYLAVGFCRARERTFGRPDSRASALLTSLATGCRLIRERWR